MHNSRSFITIGLSSVDLCGARIDGRLEDMVSFDRYIGGLPTNIACGTARLVIKSGVITGVGDEHMADFSGRSFSARVYTRGVKADSESLTGLVLLGMRNQEQFPLTFYRRNRC